MIVSHRSLEKSLEKGGLDAVLGHELEQNCSVLLASAIVVTLSVVSLTFSDILLDLDAVEEPVLRCDLGNLSGLLELLGPGEHNLDILIELLELLAAGDCFGKHPDDVAQVLSEVDEVKALDVIKCADEVGSEWLQVSHATLKLRAMVIARETVDQASCEVRHKCLNGRHVCSIFDLWHLDRSDSQSQKVGEIGTRSEVETSLPVCLKSINIRFDLCLVEEVVLADGGGKLFRVGEDSGP